MEKRSLRRGPGLTLPVDIPPRIRQSFHSGDRSSCDNNDGGSNSHSPTRHIATQTPTEHFSFTFDFGTVPSFPCGDENDYLERTGTEKRKRPMLYGKHSFREVRETSWIPRWLRRSSSGSTPAAMVVQRSVSMSLSVSPEDAKEVGKQLRRISDDFETCRDILFYNNSGRILTPPLQIQHF
ncbi:unnamed protein product [Allacma fusca]|uniref:Uncharacterized protein n=1 Tax=Allacma fusca TaxID=39272 RepID=A0A8J2P8I5_9HEXA|nr:unnamed protein product [Allacma fusca]